MLVLRIDSPKVLRLKTFLPIQHEQVLPYPPSEAQYGNRTARDR